MDKRLKAKLDQAKGVTLHKGSLRIAFRLPGEKSQTKKSLGIEPTSRNIDFALNKLGEIKMDIVRGTFDWSRHFPNDARARTSDGMMLSEALKVYFVEPGDWKKTSRYTSEGRARTMLSELGNININTITPATLKGYERQLLAKNGSFSIKIKLLTLKTTLSRALRDGVIDSNPFALFEPAEEVAGNKLDSEATLSELDIYTIHEANLIIDWHKNEPHEANMLAFLFWSGARHGETAALKWSDYDGDDGAIDILRTNTPFRGVTQTPKTGKARRVYLPSLAIEALERQWGTTGNSEFIFCGQRTLRPFSDSRILNYPRWDARLKDLGLRRLRPYVTRHCFASWMLRAGENMMDVANALGHNDTSMLQEVYGHFIPQKRHRWTLDDPQKRQKWELPD